MLTLDRIPRKLNPCRHIHSIRPNVDGYVLTLKKYGEIEFYDRFSSIGIRINLLDKHEGENYPFCTIRSNGFTSYELFFKTASSTKNYLQDQTLKKDGVHFQT